MANPADFDPRDPTPPSSPNPMVDYVQPPAGITLIATVQGLLAILFAYTAARAVADGSRLMVASLGGLAILFGAVGWGFWTCRAWGWWLVGAIYYFMFFHFIIDVTKWAGGSLQIKPVFHVISLGAEVALLYYINQPFVLRHMRFRRVPPSRLVRWSPLAAGLLLAILSAMQPAAAKMN